MNITQAVNLEDIRGLALRRLPRLLFDYIDGGVDDELGLQRNRQAFQRHLLLPRYLVDVTAPHLSTVLFGRKFDLPFGIAPMGQTGLFRRDADLMLAEAAAEANIPYVVSTGSNASLEQVARVAPLNTWFQLYGARNRAMSLDMVKRARDAGISTLVLSVDVPVMANRERNRRNGFRRPMRPTPAVIGQMLARPLWLLGLLRAGGLPILGNFVPYASPGAGVHELAELFEASIPAPAQTWDLLPELRALWPGTLIVKGILHPQDAGLARDAGADGVIVSNHGARQLDLAPATVDMLAPVHAAVGDRLGVLIDSGIRRGSDLVVARCLGARFGLVGRPFLFGAVAGGTAGVRKVIQTLSKEIALVLAQIGCSRFDELGPQYLAAHAAGARFNYDKEIDHEPPEPAVAGPRERAATGVRPGRAVA